MNKKRKHKVPKQYEKQQRVELRGRVVRFSSPIPPPEIMKGYEAILPSATEKFFSLAQEQSSHRQHLEKKHLNSQSTRALIGLIAAQSLSVLFAVLGFILLLKNKDFGAYAFFVGSIVPRVISFFVAHRKREKEYKDTQ